MTEQEFQAVVGEYIGRFINKWRGRNVAVYNHKTDPTKVVTYGRPIDGSTDPIRCVEPKANWESTIEKILDYDRMGKVYVYE